MVINVRLQLNYFHRHIGRLIVIATNVHAIGFSTSCFLPAIGVPPDSSPLVYKWSLAGVTSVELAKPFIRWGFVALVCVDLLWICSTSFVRAKSYNLFVITHALGSFVFLFAVSYHYWLDYELRVAYLHLLHKVCYHTPSCVPYAIAACVFYGLDHLIRIIKSRITTATLRPIPELGLTRVEIPTINTGWRAGQHVRLRVLSTGMGLWGLTEVHPFTIANVANTGEGLVLLCQKSGKWTTRMYELSSTAKYGESGKEIGRSCKIMVEGPYGEFIPKKHCLSALRLLFRRGW